MQNQQGEKEKNSILEQMKGHGTKLFNMALDVTNKATNALQKSTGSDEKEEKKLNTSPSVISQHNSVALDSTLDNTINNVKTKQYPIQRASFQSPRAQQSQQVTIANNNSNTITSLKKPIVGGKRKAIRKKTHHKKKSHLKRRKTHHKKNTHRKKSSHKKHLRKHNKKTHYKKRR